MPGGTGRRLRYWFYRNKFKQCGSNVRIDEGVIILHPEKISLGDNVWIDKYAVLEAGAVDTSIEGILKKKENPQFRVRPGDLNIGSNIHIGAYNILQSLGGLQIGDNVTTSAGVKIYTLSNYFCNELDPAMITHANCTAEEKSKVSYILSPVVVEDNVWISLDSLVLGGTIGKDSFVASKSLVLHDIPENSYASGSPAKRIRDRFVTESKYE